MPGPRSDCSDVTSPGGDDVDLTSPGGDDVERGGRRLVRIAFVTMAGEFAVKNSQCKYGHKTC